MAITFNGDPHPHREGLTVEDLLVEKKFSARLKTVFVNGTRVFKADYATTPIPDGAEVKVLHLIAGG